MIASTTHLEKPVITNHLIDVSMEIDGWTLTCTDCGAHDLFGDSRDAEDWAALHLCPTAIDPMCGIAMSLHVDGPCRAPMAVAS